MDARAGTLGDRVARPGAAAFSHLVGIPEQGTPAAARAANDVDVNHEMHGENGVPRPALLTRHAHVLLELSRNPDTRLRDLALRTGLTERTVHRIVSELVAGGFVTRERRGRRVSYALAEIDGLAEVAALASLGRQEPTPGDDTPVARIEAVEEALRAAEARFRDLVEHIPAAVYVQQEGGPHLYASPQIESITGYSAEEWVANPTLWSDVIHVLDRERVTALDDRTGISHEPFEAEYRVVRRDGGVCWVHDRSVPSRNELGEVTMWFGVVVDASARRHAEDELQRVEELQRIMIENTSDLVTLIDRDGNHMYVSPSAETMLGYRSDELVGKSLGLLHPDDGDIGHGALDLALKGTNSVARFRLRHRQGDWITLEASHIGIRDAAGLPMVLVVARDLTERAALEAQLRQADKLAAVGQLAGGIAHDFNNVLTTITGVAELLLGESEPPPDWREDIEEIRVASERAASLTRQLLAFSRRQLLRPRIVDLNEPVRTSERMLRRLIGEDVELDVSLGHEAALVLVDPSQVDQVLVNLVLNARQAMPTGGKLGISTETVELGVDGASSREVDVAGRYVRLTVTDTGEGMTATTLAHVFEPFYTTREGGSGLGLATVYGIVKQSGGHTDIASQVGVGTSISVYLPAVDGEPELVRQSAEPPKRGTETLLLVEDEIAVRRLTRRALERHGYHVLEAETPRHALELALSFPGVIDVVVSDVVMPGMNGRELVEELRILRPGTHVLFVSGYDEGAVLGTDQLPDDVLFLPKPFTPSALHQKVREAIDV